MSIERVCVCVPSVAFSELKQLAVGSRSRVGFNLSVNITEHGLPDATTYAPDRQAPVSVSRGAGRRAPRTESRPLFPSLFVSGGRGGIFSFPSRSPLKTKKGHPFF